MPVQVVTARSRSVWEGYIFSLFEILFTGGAVPAHLSFGGGGLAERGGRGAEQYLKDAISEDGWLLVSRPSTHTFHKEIIYRS